MCLRFWESIGENREMHVSRKAYNWVNRWATHE